MGILWMAYRSEAYLLAGRRDEAIQLAGLALELTRQHNELGNQAWGLRLLGEIAMHRDPPEVKQAEASYCQALALAEQLGMRPLQAHCRLGLGTLYAKVGRPEPARAELSAAIAQYRAMDMTFWLPQAEATRSQAKCGTGRGEATHEVPYEVIFEPDAVEHLQGFSARAQSIVLDQIEVQLIYQPDVETRNRKR
jgi:tetratricopeptide (TPR) repeat protein